ncbi:MAG: hypothetical protein EXR45_00710 [Chloroflexi bacterium]|nr:hypothetical protein [Chloroflexota bacterium]
MKPVLSISDDNFVVDGTPTHPGRTWNGHRVEGLLFHRRALAAAFADANPITRELWTHADGTPWDPDRNVTAFISVLPWWRACGVDAVALNLQGGPPTHAVQTVSPRPSSIQPWHASAFAHDGTFDPATRSRFGRILNAISDTGLVAIFELFSPGQDARLDDDEAIRRATDQVCQWLLDRGDDHVIINVCQGSGTHTYGHPILRPDRIHELVRQVRETSKRGKRLLVGAGVPDGVFPGEFVPDVLFPFTPLGSGSHTFRRATDALREIPAVAAHPRPMVFCDGAGGDFDRADSQVAIATEAHVSWGLGDTPGIDGSEWVPANWDTETPAGIAYLETIRSITGTGTQPTDHPDVLLADQRRMHAGFARAIRSLGLTADVTPAGAP